jgi:hypothetical protein
MSIDQVRADITGRVWQAMAQSGVDLSAIPHEQQATLVNVITDNVLLAVDEMLDTVDETGQLVSPIADDSGAEEQVLWEGRPFLSLTEHYAVTNERVRITKGMFGREREDIELIRIQDVDHSQQLSERMVNVGDIVLRSADVSKPEVTLRNVARPEKVHEIIRRAMLAAREKYRVRLRDEI